MRLCSQQAQASRCRGSQRTTSWSDWGPNTPIRALIPRLGRLTCARPPLPAPRTTKPLHNLRGEVVQGGKGANRPKRLQAVGFQRNVSNRLHNLLHNLDREVVQLIRPLRRGD